MGIRDHIKHYISNSFKSGGAVKRRVLLSYLRLHFPDISDRAMRKEIEEMIRNGHLISSSESGYSIIDSKEKLDKAVSYLDAKAEAIAIRKNTLIKNWNSIQLTFNKTLFDEAM
jgi:hypothetical protein